MTLFVIPKGSKYIVQDKNERLIYTIKKKSFGAKFVLYDASNYELYSLVQTVNGKKPAFEIILNDSPVILMHCLSVFLDPSFECRGNDMNFQLKSKDRKSFKIIKNDHEVGKLNTVKLMTGELQYEIIIEDKHFDDYISLFAIAIDRAFGDINKSK
jgi:uncharacterized protein YxjI